LFNRILPPQAAAARQGTILVGLGEMPVLLAKRLMQTGTQVTMVGMNRGRKRGARVQDLPVIEGDPTDPQVLAGAGAASARALVAASTYDEINLQVCRLAAQEFNIPYLVAHASDPDIAAQMLKLGARVVRPQFATILALEGALHFPAAFDMLSDHEDGVEVREVELSNPRFAGKLLRQIRLPGDALILGLRRDGEVLVPHGNTRLRQGDLLMLVGHQDALAKSLNQLDSNTS
jgi:Trk K+ transport system NAD-binding subunit